MTTQSGLWDKIERAKVPSNYPQNAEFWPEGSLCRITEDDITTELYGCSADQVGDDFDDELVQFILTDATKILAACFLSHIRYSNLEQTMSFFWEYEFSDSCLPLNEDVISQHADRLPWEGPQMASFLQHQWQFVAQTFSRGRCLVPGPLPRDIIFPFIQASPVGQGNFGTVFKVTVHSSHFDWDDPIHQVRHQCPHSSVVIVFFFLSFSLL